MMEAEKLDIPRLPRQEGTFRDPNDSLPLDVDSLLHLTANHFVSERTLILGQTGKGKGNAGALITEFLLEAGLPLTFIDLEGEGYSFKEICSSLLVVGRSVNADREYAPSQMGRLAELSVEQGFSVVLDLSGYADEEIFALISPYLKSLWATCERLRTPYHLILDEAHELVPEEGTTPVKSLLRRIAKRGRKRGLGVIAMSQETASLDKKFLRQMDIRILLPVSYEADIKIYHTLIPGISLDTLKNTMPAFPPGTGYVVYKHQPYLVYLLRRRTFDPSETPKLGDQRITPMLHTMDKHVLDIIDQTLPSENEVPEGLDRAALIHLVRELRSSQNKGHDELPSLKEETSHVTELEEIITQKDRELKQLLAENARLKLLASNTNETVIHLPEALQITQASIDTVTVHHVHTPAMKPAVVESVTATKQLPTRSMHVVPVNESKMRSLQQRLAHLSTRQYQMFKLLVERNVPMTVGEIAAWMNVSNSTVQRNLPPEALFKMGLMKVSQSGNAYRYKATLRELLSKEFPAGDQEELARRLLSK